MISIVGKPNTGKSSFYNLITGSHVEVAAYPFCTIDPNLGVSQLSITCPCKKFKVDCVQCSSANNFERKVPIQVVDVAGIIKEAASGKGKGNMFLSEALKNNVLLQIIDCSDSKSPIEDVLFLKEEIEKWIMNKIRNNNPRNIKSAESFWASFGISEEQVHHFFGDVKDNSLQDYYDNRRISNILWENKIIIPILNKCDLIPCEKINDFKSKISKNGFKCFSTSVKVFDLFYNSSNVVLHNKILKLLEEYTDSDISNQKLADPFEILKYVMFDVLKKKIVFPVKNEKNLTDTKGVVLPNAIWVNDDSTPLDLAYKIHKDLGDGFISAIDVETLLLISKHTHLTNLQVIKINSR